ncbi:RNA 2',3'-cyclic phosphodiesterase [Virgibacillus kekensis]|uniref:RNA 2',3'-cyclic phosphodiesterase n=1 Tax=Virgibacillus kekensis TaxID=202261 RepID=A0ABV9DDG3_9BACI
MTNTPHYFIAIPLPDFLKEQYSQWQKQLKEQLSYKQWPYKEDLHITLKFLGPVEEEQLSKLQNELTSLERKTAFELFTGQLGYFGNPRKPRVLWAGVEKTGSLEDLHQEVEKHASAAGFQSENRPYSPHITLAKKWAGDISNLQELKKNFIGQHKMAVDKVVIYRIYPGNSPKYRIEASYNLKGGTE